MRDYYSPGQAVHYSPGATKWLLANYYPFLHQGQWPPKHQDGCEIRSGVPHAPHEEVSAIAGELMTRVMSQGYSGFILFALYAFCKNENPLTYYSIEDIAKWAGKSIQAVKTAEWIALNGIKHYIFKPISIETRMMFAGLLLTKRIS